MDLETENRIAAMLLREAAELRRQAEKEGVRAYLDNKPTARARPNSRFLTATVLGVQQANRAVEVSEMWRVRQQEKELDKRLSERSRGKKVEITKDRNMGEYHRSASKSFSLQGNDARPSCSSSDVVHGGSSSIKEEGLKDEEIEEFLHSRVKRGRGAVGSRMDETGPYRPSGEDTMENLSTREVRVHRVILGPEKPSSLRPSDSSEDESDEDRRKKANRKGKSERKHKSKEKSSSSSSSRDNKRRRKEEKRRKKHH
ncbi:unnamed protein product [Linum trigynum]|uniref:Uncharacterized protein n=1 Tax=Linum trigynum TaxID=586398 RepID=A0AAV2EGU9_9ROSI